MERQYRLQKNRAFQYVYKRGHACACRDLVLLLASGRQKKVGFSVSRKVGNAVTRNRVKRRLRECIRPHLGDVKTGLYVIVARPSAAKATFRDLQRDVLYLLKKQKAFGGPDGSAVPAKRPEGKEQPALPKEPEGNRAR